MTSLPLTPAKGFFRSSVPEWGTNRLAEQVPLWSAKSPTWHQSGEPIEQFYDLTQLKRSNVRLNDQLLPKPQESTLGEKMIHLPFPAEHPYTSHVPRLKMFPSFASTAEEPKRGIAALQTQPLTSETPANNYDVLVVHKTKGTGVRHEVQDLPPESMKRGLSWHGEQGFPHTVKIHGDRQLYYPTPTSLVVPNLLARQGTDQTISDQNANATRNLERQQWTTTYERNHTGIGPVNQYMLDNLGDKKEYAVANNGRQDDNIYPWFANSYEPARPQEGRIARVQNPNYGIPHSMGAAQPDTGYIRKPTVTEREEERLLNGKEHVNLPSVIEDGKDLQWKEWSAINNPEERFAALIERQMRDAPNPLPFEERGTELLDEKKASYMDELTLQHQQKVQQMEADERWRQLEAYKPSHSMGVLKRKEQICTPQEQVSAFYGHEGKYNEERAGLYKTSYDPDQLTYKLNDDPSQLNIRNNSGSSSKDAVHYPTRLNVEADMLRTDIRTDPRNVPILSERPDIFEVFEPFQRDRAVRQQQLQPSITDSRARIQEGGATLTDSTMGAGYNTKRFLQENTPSPFARSEPLALMSAQNQNLANVRVNCVKQVKFNEHVSVGEGAGSTPLFVSKAHIESPKLVLNSPRAHISTPQYNVRASVAPSDKGLSVEHRSMERSSAAFRPSSPTKKKVEIARPDYFASLSGDDKIALSGIRPSNVGGVNLFESKSSNLGIGATSYNLFQTSYDNQFKAQVPQDDWRYKWEPGCGTPRPQTSLLNIQNSFSKTDAYRSLQGKFPETNPSLIDNVAKGRKHKFGTLNSQVLRGTLVNA